MVKLKRRHRKTNQQDNKFIETQEPKIHVTENTLHRNISHIQTHPNRTSSNA